MNREILTVIWVVSSGVCGGLILVAIEFLATRRKRRRLIAAGLYPAAGLETDEEVDRLLKAGEQDMAIRCYQAVHRVSYREAKTRLRLTKSFQSGFQFWGLLLGICVGLGIKNVAVGIGVGVLLGFVFGNLPRPTH